MNCEQIKELLLTDYADNRLTDEKRQEVDKHLAACSDCRTFQALARGVAAQVFNDKKIPQAPEYLWQRIKNEVSEESSAKKSWALFDFRNIFMFIPRPAMIMIMAALLISANVLVSKYIFPSRTRASETGEIMAYLGEDINDFGTSDDIGMDVEDYFL